MTELALLADELGVHVRTLRRAVRQQTLHAARPSPRTLELSLAERRYVRRSWPLLAALRSALRTEANVRFALLFGSAATGADTPQSDVDLIVDLRDASLDRVVDLAAKLTALVGRPVDIARLEDVESDPSVLSGAITDGRVLVDREEIWPRLRRRALSPQTDGHRDERVVAALAGIDRLLGD
jgi:predicted nucleotidyltransferase